MLAANIPTKFPIPFANNAVSPTYITYPIPTPSQAGIAPGNLASLYDGFPPQTFIPGASGGSPPQGADFNGILNQLSRWSQWQSSGGPVVYDATFATDIGGYPAGAILGSVPSGAWWLSLVDSNTTDPDAGGANWQRLASDAAVVVTTNQVVTTSESTKNYVVTADITVTLPTASAVKNNVRYGFVCRGGKATIIPDGAASIAGGTVGASYTFPNGTSGLLIRDDSGNWSVFFFTGSGTGIYVTANLVLLPGFNYLIDSRLGSFTLTLPAFSTAPATITLQDVGQALITYPVSLARSGGTGTIMSVAEDCALNMPGIEITVTNEGTTTNWRFT